VRAIRMGTLQGTVQRGTKKLTRPGTGTGGVAVSMQFVRTDTILAAQKNIVSDTGTVVKRSMGTGTGAKAEKKIKYWMST